MPIQSIAAVRATKKAINDHAFHFGSVVARLRFFEGSLGRDVRADRVVTP
jgi:hypothetical protein